MSRQEKLLAKLLAGKADSNFGISDLAAVLVHSGYRHERTTGSHMIFRHDSLPMINIQSRADGKAKRYQVKQIRDILKK